MPAFLFAWLGLSEPPTTQPSLAGPAIQFDLSAARFTSLTSDALNDEDASVPAEPGKQFLALPFLYDATTGDLTLSRSSVKGKDAKNAYGFRILAPKDGRVLPDHYDRPVVYERLELKGPVAGPAPEDSAPALLIARNVSGPRKSAADKTKSPAFKPSNETLPATGYAVLLLEIPKNARQINVELAGIVETIDLDYLKNAGRTLLIHSPQVPDNPDPAPMPPAIADIATQVAEGTPGLAALAIDQLAAGRRNWPRPETARWVGAIDAAVLSAALRDEPLVQRAAWRFFSSGGLAGLPSPNLSTQALDYLAAADDALQLRWVGVIACGLGYSGCGPAWIGPVPGDYLSESAQASAMSLLGAILRSEDDGVCAAAVDLLLRTRGGALDPKVLTSASPQAQQKILEHLEKSADPAAASASLRALLKAPQPATAAKLAALCENLNVRLDLDDQDFLAAWEGLKALDDRAALFTALAGVDLGGQVYADRFSSLLRAATTESTGDSEPESGVRQSAWTFLIRQARRLLPSGAKSASARPRAGQSAFPLLVARGARDPLVAGLMDAARRGPRTIRSQALVILLQFGYAEEAARALSDAATTTQQREVLLKELFAKGDSVVGRSALTALLGHLLRREHSAHAGWILDRLDDVRKKTAAEDAWRLAAALKAGVNFVELDRLAASLGPPASERALRWLHELGHMSEQDEQSLAALSAPEERAACLNKIDLRRASRVMGRYGVILIVETVAASPQESSAEKHDRKAASKGAVWRAPQRRTLIGPSLTFEPADEPEQNGDQKFRVLWGEKQIGEGLVINRSKSVAGPARFSPVLQVAAWSELSAGRATGPSSAENAVGPLVLQHRAVANPVAPGTVNLDIADYLRDALKTAREWPADQIGPMVPAPCPLTLRYASFGSYYGCTPDLRPPDPEATSQSYKLLGVMMVLEKMD